VSSVEITAVGQKLAAFAAELYPICRSITGDGVRETLARIARHIPLKIREVLSGGKAFDWEVPLEWNVEDAYVRDPQGRKVIDFAAHNLHIVSYSEPIHKQLSLKELRSHLHVHPTNPEVIPYRTSYYTRNWGFCLRRRDLDALEEGIYDVRINSRLEAGSLTYGEFILPGKTREEMLFFTHVCHPSLANDNTSGMAIATELAAWLATETRRYTYRIVFAPGTIGSLCWLKHNEKNLGRIRHGLVLALLGDSAPLTYKSSRRGDAEIDTIAKYVVEHLQFPGRTIPFEPYGYDERQLCSPGFDLPVGRLTRSVNDGYPQYHSSADDLNLLNPESLGYSLEACKRIVMTVEGNRRYVNLSPKGEPRLGKRGLYGAVGGQSPASRERAMLWVLSQSDGSQSLLDIASRSQIGFDAIRSVATELETAKLLRLEAGAKARNTRVRKKPGRSGSSGSRIASSARRANTRRR
jgi:aminopeptidase-like protein